MKNLLYILALLVLLSCKNETTPSVDTIPEVSIETEKRVAVFSSDLQLIIKNWSAYYRKRQADFDLNDFNVAENQKIEPMEGSVYGVFDKEFNSVYTDFLVFSQDRESYIDIDSYAWSVDEDNNVMFEADQEINLVNIPLQRVKRIGFYGPSARVEDAFWLDEYNVVLVGNSYDNIPFIKIFNLIENEYRVYFYKEPLNFKSEYLAERFKQKGLKFTE